jgi:DMSO/TMAO reductase YedYZ molybdopterin-dependent catalytic subunit
VTSVRARLRPDAPAPLTRRVASPTEALIGGSVAALVVGLGMLLLRSTLEVRSIPERTMEWLLLFVPTSVFENLLLRFGLEAKRYALDAAIVLMLAALAAIGYGVLRAQWRVAAIAMLGVAFWLFVMLVVMPLTSAGVFAMDLEDGKRATIGGYLAVGLSYAAVLAAMHTWIAARANASESAWRYGGGYAPVDRLDARWSESIDRRLAIGLIGTAGVAYVAAYAAALLLPKREVAPSVLILDPQEPVPSGGIEMPNAHPQTIATPVSAPTPLSGTPVVQAGPQLPEPAPARQLERDKDGAVVRSGRQPGQLAEPITSNSDFYVVTKNAGGDPVLHPQGWQLRVDGEVGRSFQLDYATLRKLPSVEMIRTLECISNFVGKPELAPFGAELISTAAWKGVRVSDILQLTGGPNPGAEWLAVLSADEYTSAIPMRAALDPATLLVYEMNGQVLPREHGYPARLLVPGRYGMKNPKWVIGLRPMHREFVDWYGQRNWSKSGIVQTMSRIDVPAAGANLTVGPNGMAGIAYAGSRGVQRVEYSADGGNTWHDAQILDPAPSPDRWVRWQGSFNLPPGATLKLVARATDGTGKLQDQPFTLPEPDGGTGWPSVDVRAR